MRATIAGCGAAVQACRHDNARCGISWIHWSRSGGIRSPRTEIPPHREWDVRNLADSGALPSPPCGRRALGVGPPAPGRVAVDGGRDRFFGIALHPRDLWIALARRHHPDRRSPPARGLGGGFLCEKTGYLGITITDGLSFFLSSPLPCVMRLLPRELVRKFCPELEWVW